MPIRNREAVVQHKIEELEEQLQAAKASAAARQLLREFLAKHPALTRQDVEMVAEGMRPAGRFPAPTAARESFRKAFGAALAAAEAKGMSRTQIADRIGCNVSSVYQWEKGDGVPTEQFRAKVKRVLGVDVAALVEQAKKAANGAAHA
jgi:ribosome-binding protein aMBF1 (putative translation factor)